MLVCTLSYTNLGTSSPTILLRPLHRITWGRISNVIEVAGTLNVLRTAGTKFTSTQTGEYVSLNAPSKLCSPSSPTVLHHNPRLC